MSLVDRILKQSQPHNLYIQEFFQYTQIPKFQQHNRSTFHPFIFITWEKKPYENPTKNFKTKLLGGAVVV